MGDESYWDTGVELMKAGNPSDWNILYVGYELGRRRQDRQGAEMYCHRAGLEK